MFYEEKRYCQDCPFSKFYKGETMMASGFVCRRNPFKPVFMGIVNDCSQRKRLMKEQYKKRGS